MQMNSTNDSRPLCNQRLDLKSINKWESTLLLPAFALLGEGRWTLKVAEKGLIFFFHVVGIDAQFSGVDRGRILFEISCVGGMIDLRNYRSFFSTIIEIIPIDIVEERVGFDSRRSTRDMSETLGWVRLAQLSNDVSSGR